MRRRRRTTEQWVELLKIRCQSEGVGCSLSDSDLWGWVKAGVGADDAEDDVFAAMRETIKGEPSQPNTLNHPGIELIVP